ncbi:tripartite tricarboxylate transporter permease [Pararhizobium sp. IMCC21322]|uniref:tripartite tricarboxylate transporter permease n=1 Tax=Pararhizobium sp. IMCC21322 TaxID=3067903 RepID=UPI00274093C7|nr:tripartite tricarboxylate transporter permease [Pararhizobium sp. IMCC21322]
MFEVLSLGTTLFIGLGVLLGIVVGAIPGLTATMLIALSLPFTFSMDPIPAISMLVGMYVGGVSGSLITAIILRMPGTPASVITTLDGYPMAQRGEAGKALALAIWASFFGGLISWVFLVLLSEPLSRMAVRFSKFDYFALVAMALLLIVFLSKGNMLRGLISGALGILAATPGSDPISGSFRFTFGIQWLENGFPLLAVLIGLFAGNQILQEVQGLSGQAKERPNTDAKMSLNPRALIRHWINILRSSVLGTWIGVLPGVGANVGSAFAYSVARSFSRKPDDFGKGSEEGLVASESANNATVGGALVPLVALGIPGSVVDAILLGGLVIHGVQPGPFLFRNDPGMVYAIFNAAFIGNVIMLLAMLVLTRHIAKIAMIPKEYLLPPLVIMCVVGTFAISNAWSTVFVMLLFSFVGFGLERSGYALAPFVIGFILAPIAEENLRSATMFTDGAIMPLLLTPVPIAVIIISTIMFLLNRRFS